MKEEQWTYRARFYEPKYCKTNTTCEAFCHIAWCPKSNWYKEWVDNYNKAPWWKKIFMNADPRSAWF